MSTSTSKPSETANCKASGTASTNSLTTTSTKGTRGKSNNSAKMQILEAIKTMT
jgi:hypothetical protein